MTADPDGLFSASAVGDRPSSRSRRLVQPSPDQPAATPDRRAGLIVGVVTAVLVLALCVGGGGVVALTAAPFPTPSPTATATAPPADRALELIQDPTLREFARAGATRATRCRPILESGVSVPGNTTTETMLCRYPDGSDVVYARHQTLEDRNVYKTSVVKGFLGGTHTVDGQGPWSDSAGTPRGTFVAGHRKRDKTRYLYWELTDEPVSGEIHFAGTDQAAADAFWQEIR